MNYHQFINTFRSKLHIAAGSTIHSDQYNFNKSDWNKYKHTARNSFNNIEIPLNFLDSIREIDNAIDQFNCILMDLVRQSASLTQQKTDFYILPKPHSNLELLQT